MAAGRSNKILEQVLRGTSDANIPFEGLRRLLLRLGFGERVRGSHHIFFKERVEEILNLQPKGGKAKPYQVKQVRHVILKYRLGGEPDAKIQVWGHYLLERGGPGVYRRGAGASWVRGGWSDISGSVEERGSGDPGMDRDCKAAWPADSRTQRPPRLRLAIAAS